MGWIFLLSGIPAPLNATAYLIGVGGKQKKMLLCALCDSAVKYYENGCLADRTHHQRDGDKCPHSATQIGEHHNQKYPGDLVSPETPDREYVFR